MVDTEINFKAVICLNLLLHFPDFPFLFILQTGALDRGLGDMLSQLVEAGEHTVIYMSRKLIIEKCLGIKWAERKEGSEKEAGNE